METYGFLVRSSSKYVSEKGEPRSNVARLKSEYYMGEKGLFYMI